MVNTDLFLIPLDLSEKQFARLIYLLGVNIGKMTHEEAIQSLNRVIEVAQLAGRPELSLI